MKYLMLILVMLVYCAMPQVALASCQTITIMQDGKIKVCTVCQMGNMTTVNCM